MTRPLTISLLACLTLSLPAAALADKPAHAGGPKHKVERKAKAEPRRAARAVSARVGRDPVVVVSPGTRPRPVQVQARSCPPGLAKKDPACLPPGQAKKGIGVGQIVDLDRVHVISRPGLYGLGSAPAGQRYAIVNGRLVRVDRDTGRILSILRVVDAILD